MRKHISFLAIAAACAAAIFQTSATPAAVSPTIVISQVYGGGGNTNAPYQSDFIELYNRGSVPASLAGWSVQYASSTGSTWQRTPLTDVTLQPGAYYLVRESTGSSCGGSPCGSPLPTADASGVILMSGTAGKVALVNNNVTIAAGTCPTATIVDFVGYGGANCFEGTGPTAALSNTTAALRKDGGSLDTDSNSADFTVGAPSPRNTGSDPYVPPPPPISLRINQIQGGGLASPYVGQNVATFGVVTGVKSNGFFIQTQASDDDGDPATSEGVFVFTGNAVPAAAVVGNQVSVTGGVQEFRPSSGGPTTTEIAGTPTVTLVSSGNALPPAIDLTAAGVPSAAGGFFQLERYEGMRVSVGSFTVIEGTGGSVNEANATGGSFGDFYGVLTGTPAPFREPGIELPVAPPVPPCCIPQSDGNPERLRIDSASLGGAELEVAPGAVLTGLVGVLDFNFGAYSINLDPAGPGGVSNAGAQFTAVPNPGAHEFTVASFNMEHFFDTANDPAVPFDVALTPTAFANRLNKASLAIRNVLRTPDILGIEEMENLETLQQLAQKISADALAAGDVDPQYHAVLFEGNDPSGIDIGLLVKAGRVAIDNVVQIGKEATFVNPAGTSELLNDRPPVVLHATVTVPGSVAFPITVIVNHLKSLIGVDTLDATGARNRAKRAAQAEYLANLLQPMQVAGERIVVVGDFNAFQFTDGYVDVVGTIEGHPAPADQVLTPTTPGLVTPALEDLVEAAPADQRYSYLFNGNLQALDHALITQNLLAFAPHLEFGRMDAGFPETYRSDPNRPERLSDHDPIVAYFTPPLLTTLSYTGDLTIELGATLNVSVSVGGPASGQIAFTLDASQTANAGVVNGAAAATFSGVGLGAHTVAAAFAGDAVYAPASTSATVNVVDTTAPTIVSVTPSVQFLWPPTRAMVPLSLTVAASDLGSTPACAIVGVTNNETGATDWEPAGDLSVRLLADRDGKGTGRDYVIAVSCSDASGNTSTATTTVSVPHDQRK